MREGVDTLLEDTNKVYAVHSYPIKESAILHGLPYSYI